VSNALVFICCIIQNSHVCTVCSMLHGGGKGKVAHLFLTEHHAMKA
jgi:hypothetical protein